MSNSGDRRAGVLLHITSLPGPDGIGDLGVPSRSFVEWLARAGQRLWQTLPLHPPANKAMSPYDASSAFAGNTLLISLDDLCELGLLPDNLEAIRRSAGAGVCAPEQRMVAGQVGGEDPLLRVQRWKIPLLNQAAHQLLSRSTHDPLFQQFIQYCQRESEWLTQYIGFVSLQNEHQNLARSEWPVNERIIRFGAASRTLKVQAIHEHPEAVLQFLFDMQLQHLHQHAQKYGVWLMNDIPIYVSDNSADVWANPELFLLDENYLPKVRTGAPPDIMDPRGQIWPMPAYDWDENRHTSFQWWMDRIKHEFRYADVLRIDHFRGFADWWAVPPRAGYAEQGEWRLGPGASFFDVLKLHLGENPELIVEDLGVRTQPLIDLLQATQLPQMKVLVQGLDEDASSEHRPEAWQPNQAAYTHTHDFDTIRGWGLKAHEAARLDPYNHKLADALKWLGAEKFENLTGAAIDTVMRSRARFAIVPLQDWLDLPSKDRMNVPGTAYGNWRWLAPNDAFSDELAARMLKLTNESNRSA